MAILLQNLMTRSVTIFIGSESEAICCWGSKIVFKGLTPSANESTCLKKRKSATNQPFTKQKHYFGEKTTHI